MIRTVYRHTDVENPEYNVTAYNEEVNVHLKAGWKLITAGMTDRFIWAVLEKEV